MAIQGEFYQYPGENPYNEGFILNEYNGGYSLAFANMGKDGRIYLKWHFPQRIGSREPIDKSLPWEVKLGDRYEAIEALRHVIKELQGDEQAPAGGEVPEEDKVPF